MTHIPIATYRIQFTSNFNFSDAEQVIEYLRDLGISDLYASPIFKAKKGSAHGYDIADPNLISPELGSEEGFEKLIEVCRQNKICWLQDIVPNHMTYSHENQMLVDLLENGPNSRFFKFFDIEWNHPLPSVRDRLLAPFLGKFYQEALEGGEIKLKYDELGFSINYYETRLPVKFESYPGILSYRIKMLRNKLGMNNPDFIKFQGILYVLKSLPSSEHIDERYYQIKFVKSIIWELYNSNEQIKDFLDENVKIFNGERESSGNYDLLDQLLSEQYFRLAYWKVATEEINYRRFFNVSELISLRMENEETFNRTHSLIFKYVKENKFNGLRVDHVDGLYDPLTYMIRLKERARDCYILVEKILELEEKLPPDWPIQGTTGYEFMNYVNGIFCLTDNEKKLTNIYTKFTGFNIPFKQLFHDKKRLIIQKRMAGEVERLAYAVEALSSKDRYGIDITMHALKLALEEILTYFPIYRTYISASGYSERDRKYISEIIEEVKKNNSRLSKEVEYIGSLLLQNYKTQYSDEQKNHILDFIMKFQQLTGPLMAKGFEDTTLYIYNRFISLNEVGGKPDKFGITKKEFYEFLCERKNEWPYSLNSTSTHDTKRGEDVRARLNVLSELPEEFEEKVKYWNKLNRVFKKNLKGTNYPDKNDEYFLYQTMVGAYPAYPEEHETFIIRLKEYIIKAVREAKLHTAWIKPDLEYESAFTSFVDKILDKSISAEFLEDFFKFQHRIAFFGHLNSLSQVLIKLTSPGVPDLYQGAEMWDFSMVDPDNRRPVDFNLRKKILSEIKSEETSTATYIKEIVKNYPDARIKLYVVNKTLELRNKLEDIFNKGSLDILEISGTHAKNLIAYRRCLMDSEIAVIAPRFFTHLVKEGDSPTGMEIWKDTSINLNTQLKWKNIFTKEKLETSGDIKAGEILKNFPVALLYGSSS